MANGDETQIKLSAIPRPYLSVCVHALCNFFLLQSIRQVQDKLVCIASQKNQYVLAQNSSQKSRNWIDKCSACREQRVGKGGRGDAINVPHARSCTKNNMKQQQIGPIKWSPKMEFFSFSLEFIDISSLLSVSEL